MGKTKNLIHKGQCWGVCACVSVLYRNPNRWTDLDKIWHGGGPRGGRFLGGSTQYPPPTPVKVRKGGPGTSGASAMRFGKNFIKPHLNHPGQHQVTQANK